MPFMISGQETEQALFLQSRSPHEPHNLEPVTSILDLDLYILKMYLSTNNDVSRSRLSKVREGTEQTDRRDQRHYHATLAGDSNSTMYLFVTKCLSNKLSQQTTTKFAFGNETFEFV